LAALLFKRVDNKSGFTLTEILIVVIITAVLAAFAVPVLTKSIEKSKTAEAVGALNIIRMAEKDYFLDNKAYTLDIASLNIDDNSVISSGTRYFDYSIETADADGFTARATRRDGPYSGDYYTIDQTGVITSNGHFQL
jgi:type IV pilus assembly protein PilE